MGTFDQTIKWLNKTEGRDKMLKILQYGSRFLIWYHSKNGDKADKYKILFYSTYEARRIFRLAKSLNEICYIFNRMKKGKGELYNEILEVLNIFSRIWYSVYWYLDNLSVLSSIKVLKLNPYTLHRGAMTFWLIALLTNLIAILRIIIANQIGMYKIRNNPTKKQEMKTMKKQNTILYFNLIKTLCDILPAGQESEFFYKIFNVNLNDGIVGAGGLISGIIAACQAF